MHPHFPESGAPRVAREMDAALGRNLATSDAPLATDVLEGRLAEHAAFLAAGGGGGTWELLSVAGLPMCIYRGGAPGGARGDGSAGTQLVLRHTQIAAGTALHGRALASADLSGCAAEGVDFGGSTLDGSVAVDGFFAGADFSRCSLRGVDFSGSDLRGARFVDADLTDADFEQADCTGADFSGANVEHARFPGALLDGVIRRTAPRRPFRERLDAMIAELRASPRVVVHAVEIRPPASEAALEAAERSFGAPLPAALRAFWSAHDGVFVQWGLRGRDDRRDAPFDFPDYGAPPGCINLLPVAQAWSTSWARDSVVNVVEDEQLVRMFGAVPTPRPPAPAVVIDNYAKYHHADLVLDGGEGLVVVASDHGADMDSSDFVDVETYLDVVLARYGACRYRNALGIGWTRTSRRVPTWSRRPALDTILAELEAEG